MALGLILAMQKRTKRSNLFITLLLLLSTISIYTSFLRKNVGRANFFVDEYHFSRKSYYFDLFFIKGDRNSPRFIYEKEALQPKIGPYIFGFFLRLQKFGDIERHFADIHFNDTKVDGIDWWIYFWDKSISKFPDSMTEIKNVILMERNISIFFSVLSMVMIFLISKRVGGILLSCLAVYLVGTNNLVLQNSLLATTDSVLMFFSTASLLTVLYINNDLNLRKSNAYKQVLLSIVLGVLLALGVGVKISGILIVVFISLYFVASFIQNYRNQHVLKRLYVYIVVVYSTFFLLFVYLNPILYHNTWRNMFNMFYGRLMGAEIAQHQFPSSSVNNRMQALKLVVGNTILPHGSFINFDLGKFPIDLFFVTVGLFVLIKKTRLTIKNWLINDNFILLLWFLTMFVGLVLYMRNNWSRYYLETVVIISLIEAQGVIYIFTRYLGFGFKLLKRENR